MGKSATTLNRKKVLKASERKPNKQNSPSHAKQEKRKKGRPNGKRTHPDYVQVTTFLHKETYNKVRFHLQIQSDKKKFGDLIDELMCKWLSSLNLE